MDPIIREITELEIEYGHRELYSGIREEEVAGKIDVICKTLGLIGKCSSDAMQTAALESVLGLIDSRALSPECLAYLLFATYPDDIDKYAVLAPLYKNRSMEDYAVFQAVYFARQFAKTNYDLHVFDKYKIINEKYRSRYGKTEQKTFVGRCAVYTVITGRYDDLRDPAFINPKWDYYCFTDDPDGYRSEVWNIRKLDHLENDPSRTQRYAKTHPFLLLQEYDYTIYIDGKFCITGDIGEYMSMFSRGSSMLCFPHPDRQVLEDEVEAIKIRQGKAIGTEDELDKQVAGYRQDGYRDDVPLVESACLIRSNHDNKLNAVMEDWWNEILTKTDRDQLSLGYVCWKNGYSFDISPLDIYDNEYMKFYPHSR